MTRRFASLQRRPFLTPIWLTVLSGLFAVGCLGFAAWAWGIAESTTVIVVRHAEKDSSGGEALLTPAGEARAALLSRMFGMAGAPGHVDAIYVSTAARNRMTAAPLAKRLHLTPTVVSASDPRALARRVLREHSGQRILIVGHSDTVPDIVESLSGAQHIPEIGDDEYGTMYIVSVPRIGHAAYLRLTY